MGDAIKIERKTADSAENSLQKAESDSLAEKLSRETNLLGTGLIAGFRDSTIQAFENPAETGLKFGTAMAIGVGLTLLQRKAGIARLGAEVIGSGLAVSFLLDTAPKLGQLANSISDTWSTSSNHEHNEEVARAVLGPLAFDTCLFSAGGMSGVLATRTTTSFLSRTQVTEVPLWTHYGRGKWQIIPDSDFGRFHRDSRSAVALIEAFAPTESAGGKRLETRFGTAFAVTADGKLASSHHLLKGALDVCVIDSKGVSHDARVIAADGPADLAIVQLVNPAAFNRFTPMRLAASAPSHGTAERLFSCGFPNNSDALLFSTGQMRSVTPELSVALAGMDALTADLAVAQGSSGAPIVNRVGDVVAVTSHKVKFDDGSAGALATRVSRVRDLLQSCASPGLSPNKLAPSYLDMPTRGVSIFPASEAPCKDSVMSAFGDVRPSMNRVPAQYTEFILEGTEGTTMLLMRAQLRPQTRDILVKPVALNGQAISPTATWAETSVPISSARLRIRLDRGGNPYVVESYNDPLKLLAHALPTETIARAQSQTN